MSVKKLVTWESEKKVVLYMGAPVDMTAVSIMANTHGAKYLCRVILQPYKLGNNSL